MKIEKEPDSSVCPVCNRKLVQIYFDGTHPFIPPDSIFEGFVDSDGWYEVNTIPDSELKEPYRFDYAGTRDLNEILKGLDSDI